VTYHLGQVIPFTPDRGVWRCEMPPQWFIFRSSPMAELPAEAWLLRQGALDAWHPVEKKWRIVGGAKRRKVPYIAAVAPGWVFVLLDREPHWDVLFDRARGKLTHVVGRDGIPLAIPETAIEQMAQVPERMQARLDAIAEARRIRPGDRATLDPGKALAWTVEVTAIHGTIARVVIPLLGDRETEVDVARLERLMG
jgi:hypothetical protein